MKSTGKKKTNGNEANSVAKHFLAYARGYVKTAKKKSASATLDLSQSPVKTMAEYVIEAQDSIRPKVKTGEGSKSLGDVEVNLSAEQKAAQERFDKLYRPFVYKVLLANSGRGGLGFVYKEIYNSDNFHYKVPYRNGVSGEEVYSEVWRRLFGVDGNEPALLSFNVSDAKDKLGKGAFRHFLRLTVFHVYHDMMRKDLMVQKDLAGNTIYQRDPHTGKYKLDKKGKKIPCKVPRNVSGDDAILEKNLTAIDGAQKRGARERAILRQRIELYYLAYLHVHEALKGSWFYRASAEMFEKAVSPEAVRMNCLVRGEITNRRTWDTALSRFRKAVGNKLNELMQSVGLKNPRDGLSQELFEREWKKASEVYGWERTKEIQQDVMSTMMAAYEDGDPK